MNIGFIGLGIMGKPMATNLVRAGFDVWVNDLNQDSMKALRALGAHEATLEDIAVHANRLIVLHEGNVAFQGTPKEVFSHIQELDAIGIGVPQITRITHSLMERGLPLRTPAITVNQAAMDILSIFGRDVRDDNVHNEDMP